MTKVSAWSLEEGREKELIDQLWSAISLLRSKGETIDFLKALLMPGETIMLAKRIEMVKLHNANSNLSFNEIRKLLHITKVTAYKWKDRSDLYQSEFKVVIDRIKKMEQEKLARDRKKRKPGALKKDAVYGWTRGR